MNGEIPFDLLAAAALLLANRFVAPALLRKAPIYYTLQVVDVAAVVWFAMRGVAGLEHMRVPGFVIAGLFAMHVVVNASRRGRALAADPRPPWRRSPPDGGQL